MSRRGVSAATRSINIAGALDWRHLLANGKLLTIRYYKLTEIRHVELHLHFRIRVHDMAL